MEGLATYWKCGAMPHSQAMQRHGSILNSSSQTGAGCETRMGAGCPAIIPASQSKLGCSFRGQRLNRRSITHRFGVMGLKARELQKRTNRYGCRVHVHPPNVDLGRPFEGLSGVEENFLDDVSSYIFRRLRAVLGPYFPQDFDPLAWLPMEIHCKLHRSEVIATLLVRESLMFALDFFLYRRVDGICRWACRTYSSRLPSEHTWSEEDFKNSVFRAMLNPIKFTIILWSATRALHNVAPLFKVKTNVHWVGNTRAVGLIVALTWFLSNWKGMFVRQLASEHRTDAPRIVAADKVVSLLLYYLAVSAAGEITGFGLRSLLAVGGISSIAVGLAAKEIVSNFFGGTVLFVTRPFVIGERIKAGQFSGQVQDIGFLQTKILGFDKVPILVPNQAFINQVITNYSRAKGKLMDVVFPVRNQDVFLVEKITARVLEYLRTHPDVDKAMGAPTCHLKSLGSMGTEIALQCVIPTKSGVNFFQTQQRIVLRVAQIIVEEGASLGSNAPFSPTVPSSEVIIQGPVPASQ